MAFRSEIFPFPVALDERECASQGNLSSKVEVSLACAARPKETNVSGKTSHFDHQSTNFEKKNAGGRVGGGKREGLNQMTSKAIWLRSAILPVARYKFITVISEMIGRNDMLTSRSGSMCDTHEGRRCQSRTEKYVLMGQYRKDVGIEMLEGYLRR